jgi:hypothetical protein
MTTNRTSHTDCTHPATKAARAACRKARAAIDTEARDLVHFLNQDTFADIDHWVTYAARRFCNLAEGTATDKARAILDYFAPSGDEAQDARRRANGYTITTDFYEIRSIIRLSAS